jgi:hypothetical protein
VIRRHLLMMFAIGLLLGLAAFVAEGPAWP